MSVLGNVGAVKGEAGVVTMNALKKVDRFLSTLDARLANLFKAGTGAVTALNVIGGVVFYVQPTTPPLPSNSDTAAFWWDTSVSPWSLSIAGVAEDGTFKWNRTPISTEFT